MYKAINQKTLNVKPYSGRKEASDIPSKSEGIECFHSYLYSVLFFQAKFYDQHSSC